jgi:hypothetical protein
MFTRERARVSESEREIEMGESGRDLKPRIDGRERLVTKLISKTRTREIRDVHAV